MNTSNDLFILVKSLSATEKRLFTQYAQRSGKGEGRNYLRLFGAISSQSEYDEAVLKREFEGEAFVRNFSVAKAYLYDMLLHCLRQIRKGRSVEMELRESLDEIELLYRRGLRSQAAKRSRQALKRARKYELHPYHAELLRWQRRLINWQDGKGRDQLLLELDAQEKRELKMLEQDVALRGIRSRMTSAMLNQVDLRDSKIASELDQLMAHPLLTHSPNKLSFGSRLSWYSIQATYHRLQGSAGKTLEAYRESLSSWEAAPHQVKANPDLYLNTLITYMDACLREDRFPEFQEQSKRLFALKFKDPVLLARAFSLGRHLELRYAITTGELTSGMELGPFIETGLAQHSRYLSPGIELTFLYNLAVVHFLSADYKNALGYINRLLNRPSSKVRQDIPEAARMFELLCHLARGNFDLLESLLRSMRRRLRHRPRAFPYEQPVLKAIEHILHQADTNDWEPALAKLKKQLTEMEGAAHTIGREEILLWTESQLEGRPVSELMKQQLAERKKKD